jgi:hypothetical protein
MERRHAFLAIEHVCGASTRASVSAIKPYEGFGDIDHTIKDLMSL